MEARSPVRKRQLAGVAGTDCSVYNVNDNDFHSSRDASRVFLRKTTRGRRLRTGSASCRHPARVRHADRLPTRPAAAGCWRARPSRRRCRVRSTRFRHWPAWLPDRDCIGGVVVHRLVACGDAEIGIAQLDAEGARHITLAQQVGRHLLAQAGENVPEFGLVVYRMQVAVKRGFAADADRARCGSPTGLSSRPQAAFVQPVAVAVSELLHQPERIGAPPARQSSGCRAASALERTWVRSA